MRTTSLLAGVAVSLALSSNPAHAQTKTPNTGSGGDEYASDGGAGARWWNKKGKQYPKCEGPAKKGALLTGQIVEEAYKKPEDIDKVNDLGAQREEVKHELQVCIADNYKTPTYKGGIEENTQSDPGDDGSNGGGTPGSGTGGNGKPSTGKGGTGKPGTGKTAPPKKTPPLSGGANKGGGANTLPGYPLPSPTPNGRGQRRAAQYKAGLGGYSEGHMGAGRDLAWKKRSGARERQGHDRAADLGYERPSRVSQQQWVAVQCRRKIQQRHFQDFPACLAKHPHPTQQSQLPADRATETSASVKRPTDAA